jgi:hypothetical protein
MQVRERDGYKCVATGQWSANYNFENVPEEHPAGQITKGAHILRRAVLVFKAEFKNRKERVDVSNLSLSCPYCSHNVSSTMHQSLPGIS